MHESSERLFLKYFSSKPYKMFYIGDFIMKTIKE